MRRILIPVHELQSMVIALIKQEGHADELLPGHTVPIIKVFIDSEGAHVRMLNVKEL